MPADELEQVKRRMLGLELRRFQSIAATLDTLGHGALEGDPLSHLEAKRRAIAAVEPDSLRELARRHLHPERHPERVTRLVLYGGFTRGRPGAPPG